MAKCLVLGANGFIGSHLVDALVNNGHKVRAFDRLGKKPIFNNHKNIEVIYGDFLNKNDLVEALKDIDYVFHFISSTSPATSENDPLIDIETNIRMSVELFQACSDAKIKRIIFSSTGGAIYGVGSDKPRSEKDIPLPVSPYAIGKLTIENYLRYFKVKHNLDSVSLRISNPYGERQPLHRKQGVIPIFLEKIVLSSAITVLGDGSMVRDYVYVKDIASIIADIFTKPLKYEVYNIGSGQGISVNDLVSAVSNVTGIKPKVVYKRKPPTFVDTVILDTSRFRKEYSINNLTSLDEGLKATYSYIKEQVKENNEK